MKPRYRIRLVPLLVIFLGIPAVAIVLLIGLLNAFDLPLERAVEMAVEDESVLAVFEATQLLLALPMRLLFIVVVFVLALVVRQMSYRMVDWLFAFQARFVSWLAVESAAAPRQAWTARWSAQRRETVQTTVAGVLSFSAFALALYLSLNQFLELGSMAVFATVLATALGFASRDYIGDLLAGLSNLFEDNLDVGEKVEVERSGESLQGTVETVSIRRAALRTLLGERVIVPHGEIRVLRNFSRGVHSGTRVMLYVAADDLSRTLALLGDLPPDTADSLPDLLEPWRIRCLDGRLAQTVALEITAKAPYGRGVALRLEMLTFVEGYLHAHGIRLKGAV